MYRKIIATGVLIFVLGFCLWSFVGAGDLNPAGPPTAGTMKTLDEVEPRTAIYQSDVPLIIAESGSYYLAEDVSVTGSVRCIQVNVDNVTIDLNGFSITGSESASSYGIYMNMRSNVEIRNGTIRDFSSGIYENSSYGDNYRVLGVRVFSCAEQGIYLYGCVNCHVKDCTVADGGTTELSGLIFAIRVGSGSMVTGNTVYNFGTSSNCSVIGISATSGSLISKNSVYSVGESSAGISVRGISASYGCTVTDNTSSNNGTSASGTVYGIYLSGYNCVNNNTAYNNNGTNMNAPTSCVFGFNCAP